MCSLANSVPVFPRVMTFVKTKWISKRLKNIFLLSSFLSKLVKSSFLARGLSSKENFHAFKMTSPRNSEPSQITPELTAWFYYLADKPSHEVFTVQNVSIKTNFDSNRMWRFFMLIILHFRIIESLSQSGHHCESYAKSAREQNPRSIHLVFPRNMLTHHSSRRWSSQSFTHRNVHITHTSVFLRAFDIPVIFSASHSYPFCQSVYLTLVPLGFLLTSPFWLHFIPSWKTLPAYQPLQSCYLKILWAYLCTCHFGFHRNDPANSV